ncbi:release factor glutamine methyltransferase [Alkalibacterium putridalgicola]|uniref:peptide chain release factor N(5)-glutamine methyltransferase n=1 Tax=Alkalibacterium putridalgicola TaxID=426703 RepID=A0A1H7RWJ3_9LACT|nr:peptide chain release factor N(5)-glutamine methyltransferase [Alkalibacterium putridalgicola]GEK88312.1 release factor glutamine methyltransferase [Alkalibacterium putridalgicola]SEL64691.1 release factor glutamine methyltransferase [Alkalibacterium putridalgicola]
MTTKSLSEASTYAEVLSWASSFLEQKHRDTQIAKWLMKERFALSLTDFIRLQKKVMDQRDKDIYVKDITEAGKGRPPQQIVGHEWFYDRQFKVTEATLIPRPETEEWFHEYIRQLPDRPLRVIDIGTGSGVLAVSHKLERPQDEVVAVDISQAALDVARLNAENLGAEVTFYLSDMMTDVEGKFDLILSNPPYISQSERSVMDESVIEYEPHIALFAEEEGLYFYRKIAADAVDRLNPGGYMIFEFGYRQGDQIRRLCQSYFPEAKITLEKDFNHHDRTIHIRNEIQKEKEGE